MFWLPIYIGWIVFEVLIAILTRTRSSQGQVKDRGTQPLLWVVIFLSLTACGFAEYRITPSFPLVCRTIATVILTAGLCIRITAVLSLGKAFSANVAIREAQRLNQTGIYRLVRHPSYSGLVMIFFALGLHARNPISLACAFVPTTAMLLYRIRIEEAALASSFGLDYQLYAARTKCLFPWVY